MIEGGQNGATILKSAQAIEPHGVKPLEDVAVLAVLRDPSVCFAKALDVLEAGDDSLLTRGAPTLLFGNVELRQFPGEFIEVGVTHSAPPS